MKNHTNQLKKLLLLSPIAFMMFSCSKEEVIQENQEISTTKEVITNVAKETPSASNFDFDVAMHYAPMFFQDVDRTDGWCRNQSKSGSADWITRVNFDGDWNAKNNWENMPGKRNDGVNNLYAQIYYNVAVTQSHYYVLYSAYHPRDWTDIPGLCQKDSHENDMEGVLISAVRNSDGSYGEVERLVTKFHTGVKKYWRTGVSWYFKNQRPEIFLEAKGHGMRRFYESDKDGTYIKYYPSPNIANEPDTEIKAQILTYTLESAEVLWDRRYNTSLFASNRKAFVGDNGSGSNKASAPWGWEEGMMGKNPAQYIKNLFNLNSSYKTGYIRDRYMK